MQTAQGKRISGSIVAVAALAAIALAVGIGALSDTRADETIFEVRGDDAGFLGVGIDWGRERPDEGARITDVIDDSPAAAAGLLEGDVILEVEGRSVRGPQSLVRRIRGFDAGETIELTLLRDGSERTIDVELAGVAERIHEMMPDLEHLGERLRVELKGLEGLHLDLDDFAVDLDDLGVSLEGLHRLRFCEDGDCNIVTRHFGNRPLLGVGLAETTPELRSHLGGDEETGVLVSRVYDESPAEQGGVEVGDLIVEIDGEPVGDTGDIRRALRDKWGESVDVRVIRDGAAQSLQVTFPEPDDDHRGRTVRPSSQRSWRQESGEAHRAAAAEVRRVLAQVRSQQSEALRQAREVQREALSQAREESREALRRTLREARRSSSGAWL